MFETLETGLFTLRSVVDQDCTLVIAHQSSASIQQSIYRIRGIQWHSESRSRHPGTGSIAGTRIIPVVTGDWTRFGNIAPSRPVRISSMESLCLAKRQEKIAAHSKVLTPGVSRQPSIVCLL